MNSYSYKEIFQDNNIEIIGMCDKAYDNKGTPFVVITSGGLKEQCETYPVLFANPVDAAKRFEDELLFWLNGRRRVYIRMIPELRKITLIKDSLHNDFSTQNYYVVAARLTAY